MQRQVTWRSVMNEAKGGNMMDWTLGRVSVTVTPTGGKYQTMRTSNRIGGADEGSVNGITILYRKEKGTGDGG